MEYALRTKVEVVKAMLNEDALAVHLRNRYQALRDARRPWENEKRELRDFLFATDTTKTTNAKLPWKNKTTIPKLTQIRDNLHANYMASLFPNEDWFTWEGSDDDSIQKAKAIRAYMSAKFRDGNFERVVSSLIYDYIDYGNAVAQPQYVADIVEGAYGTPVDNFIGPLLIRHSPMDVVVDITAMRFEDCPKFTRRLVSLAELALDAQTTPSLMYDAEAINKITGIRREMSGLSANDMHRSQGYIIDGFGDLSQYYTSGYVEVIDFEGDIYDEVTDKFKRGAYVSIADRTHVIRNTLSSNWVGTSHMRHVGWRERPDNLLAMGPLDNLVGMQYRIDHIENLKSDIFDLIAHPVLKIKGFVEDFDWMPGARIFMGDEGDVSQLQIESAALNAAGEIAGIMQNMEEMAGAPRQALGFRTPGEKTAYEVQATENAYNRIFQSKIAKFERDFLEPLMNSMLELARRNLDATETIRVVDDDFGVQEFMKVSKNDITGRGRLRALGARHFATTAKRVQELSSFLTTLGTDPGVRRNLSGKNIAKTFEQLLNIEKYNIYGEDVQLAEDAEAAMRQNFIQQRIQQVSGTPPQGGPIPDGSAPPTAEQQEPAE